MRGKFPKGVFRRHDSEFLWIRYRGPSGELIRESTQQCSPKMAEKIRAKRLVEVQEYRHFPSRRFEKIMFQELLDGWKRHLGQRFKKNKFQYLFPEVEARFGHKKASQIASESINKYLLEREADGLSASSLNHRRSILNSVFNFSIKWKLYDENPVQAIRQFKEPPGRQRMMAPEEFQALLGYSEQFDIELFVFLMIAPITTLRKGEILQRKWSEVQLDGWAHIQVPESKNGEMKIVPLPQVVVDAIKRLPSFGKHEYLFPSRSTTRFPNPRQPYMWDIGGRFRKACSELRIKDLRIHDLRHAGPSILLTKGVSDDIVRKLTGHKSRELKRYQHLSREFRKKTVEQIADELLTRKKTQHVM